MEMMTTDEMWDGYASFLLSLPRAPTHSEHVNSCNILTVLGTINGAREKYSTIDPRP